MQRRALLLAAVAAVFALGACERPKHLKEIEERLERARQELDAARVRGRDAYYEESEKQGRALIREYPDNEVGYFMVLRVAARGGERAEAILEEISSLRTTPKTVRARIAAIRAKNDALGKTVELKFRALDGRQIDLEAMRGKVVLIDFWATWCAPCIAEFPKLKALYDRHHGKGFEVICISLDQDKARLERFLAARDLPWPQCYDGKGWQTDLAARYAINSVPTVWLIDKAGRLVLMTARENLEEEVERLLAQRGDEPFP